MDQGYQPLQDKAYIHLKNLIQNDELDESVIYSETKMAKELGISRTPFKAALVRLSQDKYIDIIPSKGFRVHVLSEADIETTYQTRTAIELFCALMLMEQRDTPAGKAVLEKMASSIEKMNASAAEDSPEHFREQDKIFHTALLGFADNEEFNRLYEFSIYHQIVTAAKGHHMTYEERLQTLSEHTRILEAIRSGKADDCYRAVQQHMLTNKKGSLNRAALPSHTNPA